MTHQITNNRVALWENRSLEKGLKYVDKLQIKMEKMQNEICLYFLSLKYFSSSKTLSSI